MNLLSLSVSYLRFRPLQTALHMLLLGLGVALIALLALLLAQMQQRIQKDGAGFDMVVGAKGSPMQLILSSIYHADMPTGNIPYQEYERLQKNRMVRQVIPLALGDAYQGFRMVGTTRAYPEHYRANLAQGTWFDAPFDAVLGAQVAQATQAALGDSFVSNHGLVGDGHAHAEYQYVVKGVLAPTGTVLDRLVFTHVESIWRAHGQHHPEGEDDPHTNDHPAQHPHDHDHAHEKEDDHNQKKTAEKEITALLVSFRSPAAAAIMPRQINRQSVAQAATPAFEIARMLTLLGVGLDTLRGIGILLVGMALLSLFIALWQTMEQRRFDLAVMRGLGAGRGMLLRLILLEGMLVTLGGILVGMVLAWVCLSVTSRWLPEMSILPLPLLLSEAMAVLCGAVLLCGGVASVLPAIKAYRVDVARTLSSGR